MCIKSIFNWYSCRWQSKLFSLKNHPCILDIFCNLPSFLVSTKVNPKWELKYEGLSFFGFSVVFCNIRIETCDDHWSGIFRREALALSGSCTELPFEPFLAPKFNCVSIGWLLSYSTVLCIWSNSLLVYLLGSFYFCKVQIKSMTSLRYIIP